MEQGGRQGNQQESYVDKFLGKLRELGNDLSKLEDKLIFHPEEGYAKKIVDKLELEGVQLRRFYAEIRNIYEKSKEGRNILYYLYRLYPITEYQVNRRVINKQFGELVKGILKALEKDHSEESLRKASDFFMAMVAYSKTR